MSFLLTSAVIKKNVNTLSWSVTWHNIAHRQAFAAHYIFSHLWLLTAASFSLTAPLQPRCVTFVQRNCEQKHVQYLQTESQQVRLWARSKSLSKHGSQWTKRSFSHEEGREWKQAAKFSVTISVTSAVVRCFALLLPWSCRD